MSLRNSSSVFRYSLVVTAGIHPTGIRSEYEIRSARHVKRRNKRTRRHLARACVVSWFVFTWSAVALLWHYTFRNWNGSACQRDKLHLRRGLLMIKIRIFGLFVRKASENRYHFAILRPIGLLLTRLFAETPPRQKYIRVRSYSKYANQTCLVYQNIPPKYLPFFWWWVF